MFIKWNSMWYMYYIFYVKEIKLCAYTPIVHRFIVFPKINGDNQWTSQVETPLKYYNAVYAVTSSTKRPVFGSIQ